MDNMLGDNQNQKDTSENSLRDRKSLYFQDNTQLSPSPLLMDSHKLKYSKTTKLITALYMVTDIMESNDPIRMKLRTIGAEIISDVNLSKRSMLGEMNAKVNAIMSFLNLSYDMGMISEMNFNILMKEFSEMKYSIRDYKDQKTNWLEGFMAQNNGEAYGQEEDRILEEREKMSSTTHKSFTFFKGHPVNKRHDSDNGQAKRLGVQKGSTLMNAISNIDSGGGAGNEIKDKRREEILSIIKDKQNEGGYDGLSVSDIKDSAKDVLKKCSTKTIQRELVSMVSDGILRKIGEKRWSKYLLAS